MNLFAGIKTFIFILSSCVLYPVLLLLAGLSLWIFFECGALFGDWLRRKRLAPDRKASPVESFRTSLEEQMKNRADEADIQILLRKAIQNCHSRLDKYRIVSRVGPALGLIGTLVPMGTALASLGQGDMSVMTSELVVAYTTTVVGLVIGSISYLVFVVRRRFAEDDIREMEFLTEKRFGGSYE